MMTWEQKKKRSIGYLNKYRSEISQEGYDSILYVIGTQALEDIFVTEDDIIDMIQLETDNITANELIEEIKEQFTKEDKKWYQKIYTRLWKS